MVIVECFAGAGMAKEFTQVRKHNIQIYALIHPEIHSSDNHGMPKTMGRGFPVTGIRVWGFAPDLIEFVGYGCLVNAFLRVYRREEPYRLEFKEITDVCIVIAEILP